MSGTDVAIVLTAAIVVSRGSTAVEEAEIRRQQYLAAARFYSRFAPVFILENSGYDLLNDPDFAAIPGVRLWPVAAQENEARGKGYREFHALDLWYDNEEQAPTRFLKITGRYLCSNVARFLEECRGVPEDTLLFDRYARDRIALTSIFSVSWTAYRRYLYGLYDQVDDARGLWIEHVIYRALEDKGAKCRFFIHEPNVEGMSGSSGRSMKVSRFKFLVRQATRGLNRTFDQSFLHGRGTFLKRLKAMIP